MADRTSQLEAVRQVLDSGNCYCSIYTARFFLKKFDFEHLSPELFRMQVDDSILTMARWDEVFGQLAEQLTDYRRPLRSRAFVGLQVQMALHAAAEVLIQYLMDPVQQ